VSRLLPAEPWRRNQHVTAAMVFVVFTAFAFVLPFLPLYVRELGVRGDDAVALWAGVLIGVAPLLAGLLAPLWGRLADRHGPKRMAVLALGGYVVLLALSAAVTSVGQLLALRIGVGLFGGIGPLGLAMATSLAPREQTGRAVGTIQAAQILSAAVGPLLGGLLADLVGIRRTFLATAALCACALALVSLCYKESPPSPAAATRRSPFAEVLRLPGHGLAPGRALPGQLHRAVLHPDPSLVHPGDGRSRFAPRPRHRHLDLALLGGSGALGGLARPRQPPPLAPCPSRGNARGRGGDRAAHGGGVLVRSDAGAGRCFWGWPREARSPSATRWVA
jgi:MFS family permease